MYVFWIPLIGRLNIIVSWHKRQKTGVIFLLDFVLISAPNKYLFSLKSLLSLSFLDREKDRERERECVSVCIHTHIHTQ